MPLLYTTYSPCQFGEPANSIEIRGPYWQEKPPIAPYPRLLACERWLAMSESHGWKVKKSPCDNPWNTETRNGFTSVFLGLSTKSSLVRGCQPHWGCSRPGSREMPSRERERWEPQPPACHRSIHLTSLQKSYVGLMRENAAVCI